MTAGLAGGQVTVAGYRCSGLAALPVDIEVGSHDFEIKHSAGGVAAPGGVNGFVFTFANAPAITGVTRDPTSSSGHTPALGFTGDQISWTRPG